MAINCGSYGLNLEIALCTDGPVGNGNSSLLRIYVADNSTECCSEEYIFDDRDTEITPPQLWNGSDTLTFTVADPKLNARFGGCDLDGVSFTVSPVGGNQALLRVVIDLSNCVRMAADGGIYSECFDDTGPHQIVIEETVPFTTAGCTPPTADPI